MHVLDNDYVSLEGLERRFKLAREPANGRAEAAWNGALDQGDMGGDLKVADVENMQTVTMRAMFKLPARNQAESAAVMQQ